MERGHGNAVGAAINIINGWLSPEYFRHVMGWTTPHVWLAAVAQGGLEGAIYGFVGTMIYTGLIPLFLGRTWVFSLVRRWHVVAFVIVAGLWVFGGLTAGVVTLTPFELAIDTWKWVSKSIWLSVLVFPLVSVCAAVGCAAHHRHLY